MRTLETLNNEVEESKNVSNRDDEDLENAKIGQKVKHKSMVK